MSEFQRWFRSLHPMQQFGVKCMITGFATIAVGVAMDVYRIRSGQ